MPGLTEIGNKEHNTPCIIDLKYLYDEVTMNSKGDRIATINCNKCGRVLRQEKCDCGHTVCHLRTRKNEPRIYLDFRTKAPLSFITAKQVLRHMITAHESGTYNVLDYNPASREQFQLKHQIDKYLEVCKKKVELGELSLGTLGTYTYQLAHVKRLIGDIDVREVDHSILENDLSNQLEMNTASKRCIIRALRGFYSWQERRPRNEKIIRQIPPFFYPKGNNDSKVRTVPSVEMIKQALLKIPAEHRDVFEYAMLTGIRPGENCTLKISDHNLDRKEITIQRSLSGGNRIRESDKEEHKSNIAMSERCIEIFKKHSHGRFAADFLFINPLTGKRYQKNFLSRLWNKYSGTGLDSYSCTRHFFCTNITRILKGDIVKTAKMMRHKSLKTTERYIHQETQELEPTSNAMAELLSLDEARKEKAGEIVQRPEYRD